MTSQNHRHLQRALEKIPWATQTNAKRYQPDWPGMPPFIERAKGCRLWDLDGREYIDYRCSLGPIILGHQVAAVDDAVRKQMQKGILFSMASPLELEAAEAILRNTVWPDQVRFMKTGNDACVSCVRLSRSLTDRDHIVSAGYHGFHDWFATTWPHAGVPSPLRDLVHEVNYNDLDTLAKVFEQYGSQIACLIIEPYDWGEDLGKEFVQRSRSLCDHYGSLLIFDEVLTGFRMALGGAPAFYGITPDFSAFAKALANGYPLSAFVGKKEVMSALDKAILTTTYAGEALSLAACCATMQIMHDENVHVHLYAMGRRLRQGFEEICREVNAPAIMYGLEVSQSIRFTVPEPDATTLYNRLYASLFQQGIFANVRWFVSYSHQPSDIDETLDKMRLAMKETLADR